MANGPTASIVAPMVQQDDDAEKTNNVAVLFLFSPYN